jgi:hypothetical protein
VDPIKNVVAIGAGVLHGMGLGHNPMAALITRGLAEMTRLAVAMGGQPLTLAGLAGLGDLVLTCNGELSRNRTVGVELAHGRKLEEIVGSMKMVAEGIKTTNAAVDLAKRYAVEMPISEADVSSAKLRAIAARCDPASDGTVAQGGIIPRKRNLGWMNGLTPIWGAWRRPWISTQN